MGLILFPGDGDTTSPHVAWSYSGFNAFRHRSAHEWHEQAADPLVRQHIDDARQLALVLRLCIEKDVELIFL
ncbi:hypothetical protein ACIQVT_12710 [Streptomyces sp. NPDC100445]|uniref:hypothetical protein n=1 Tax=Streptomyces sp. NPDC100445 TaxID=3366102 RepID=UPI00381D32BB